VGILRFKSFLMQTFKLSFDVDILAFLSLETILATFCETGNIFFSNFLVTLFTLLLFKDGACVFRILF
jgi:hypothetical protein